MSIVWCQPGVVQMFNQIAVAFLGVGHEVTQRQPTQVLFDRHSCCSREMGPVNGMIAGEIPVRQACGLWAKRVCCRGAPSDCVYFNLPPVVKGSEKNSR